MGHSSISIVLVAIGDEKGPCTGRALGFGMISCQVLLVLLVISCVSTICHFEVALLLDLLDSLVPFLNKFGMLIDKWLLLFV